MTVPINDSDDLRIGADGASKAFLNGVQVWPAGTNVIGIDFTTCTTGIGGGQVFPTIDGVIQFWREGGSEPRNRRASPGCGETRFSEFEFANTNNGHSDGPVVARAMAEEQAGSPVVYALRTPSGDARVWKFDPVAGTATAETVAFADTGATFDLIVRDYAEDGYYLIFNNSVNRRQVRHWNRAGEGPAATSGSWWTFEATGEQPENVDVEDNDDPDGPFVWASGGDGAGNPFVMRLDLAATTWTLPEPSGENFQYVDTTQCVGVGQAIGLSADVNAVDPEDEAHFFRFLVGDASAVNITDGVTVNGDPYRTWAAAEVDSILLQSGVKMAVVGERVAALTQNGTVLIGTLVRG